MNKCPLCGQPEGKCYWACSETYSEQEQPKLPEYPEDEYEDFYW